MPRTEQEIKAEWREGDPIVISILCITYNHEKYIRDAINGFLMQETAYPFEVIVHDDASTDATVSVVKEIVESYPNIVRLVVQEENQYSKGIKITPIAFGHARGKYIALCEGDDYWTDPQKLQIQIDEMIRNPKCDISFHPAVRVSVGSSDSPVEICRHANTNLVIAAEKVIVNGGGYMPTASLMVKRRVFDELPDWFFNAPVGDYFIQCMASFGGGALYINKVMSVYRFNVPGSWTVKNSNKDKINHAVVLRVIESCRQMNVMSGLRFSQAISKSIARLYLSLLFRGLVTRNVYDVFIFSLKAAYHYLLWIVSLFGLVRNR